MARRPLVSAKAIDPVAGAVRETREFFDAGQDLTFVPGYSNVRQQMDSDIAQGRVPAKRLAIRMQYVTCLRPNGKDPDMRKVTQYRGLGYQFVEFDHPPEGIEIPLGAFKTAEGRVQMGDALLMYCDARTAARNEAQGRSAIDERTTDEFTSQHLRSAGREIGGVGHDLVESHTEQRMGTSEG